MIRGLRNVTFLLTQPGERARGSSLLISGKKKNDAEPVFAQNPITTCLQLPESFANAPVAGQAQF